MEKAPLAASSGPGEAARRNLISSLAAAVCPGEETAKRHPGPRWYWRGEQSRVKSETHAQRHTKRMRRPFKIKAM